MQATQEPAMKLRPESFTPILCAAIDVVSQIAVCKQFFQLFPKPRVAVTRQTHQVSKGVNGFALISAQDYRFPVICAEGVQPGNLAQSFNRGGASPCLYF